MRERENDMFDQNNYSRMSNLRPEITAGDRDASPEAAEIDSYRN